MITKYGTEIPDEMLNNYFSSLINQIETERKLAQFNEMLKPMKSDVDE